MTPGPATFTLAKPADTTAQWSDLDIPAIVAQLRATGVYAPAEQRPELETVVAGADADGHDLHVVVLDDAYAPFTVYRDIATELQSQVGGTVLVMGPSGRGTASSEFTRVQLEDGTSGVTAGATPAVAAQQIYDGASAPSMDWTVVTIVLVIAVVLCAVGTRLMTLRRRRSTAAADSGEAAGTTGSAGAAGADEAPTVPPAP
ncbi:DUF6676 family protein [Gordonia caeni]|uniref:Uncharacterized protein n=1 Tax=Gordonia caeni TaxID=1007097 RepID=A0ABP7PSI7_9ACTN